MPGKGTEDMLRKAASMAVCKINIDSDLRLAMTATIRKVFAEKLNSTRENTLGRQGKKLNL